jgi:hypothetical protein
MEVKYELKYCEICGGLGMRRPQSSALYCEECARLLALRPLRGRGARRGPTRATPPPSRKDEVTA